MNTDQLPPNERQLDEQAALAALDGSRELLQDLAQMFCEDAPQVLRELRQAVEADDATSARRAIHSIKGLAATFFAQPTVETAQRLEQDAINGQLESLSESGIPQLEETVQSLINELRDRLRLTSEH